MSDTFKKNLFAGSLAGTAEALITWPTENVKTRMQFHGQNLTFSQTVKNVYRNEGLASFYRGISPVLIFNIPKVALRFYSFEVMNKHLSNYNKNLNTILSGLFAGFVESTLVTVPSETIKTKFIKNPKLGVFDIIKLEGARGLYQGYFPTLYRQSLNQASRFLFFQHYKEHISKKEKFTNIHSFIGGVGAGLFSVLVSTPFDVIKTQAQEGSRKGMIELGKEIYKEHGILGYWRGSLARVLRVGPGQGMMFLSYEWGSKFYDNYMK